MNRSEPRKPLSTTSTWQSPASKGGLEAQIVLVDDAGKPIGTASKLEVHRRGMLHLAISVIIVNSSGEILMQRRAMGKYHSAGLWTNTCCSHPFPGESIDAAVARRLNEEMGIACALSPMFATTYRAELANGLIEHEHVHVYGGQSDRAPVPDSEEVMAWRWQGLDELERELAARPETYSAWFNIYFARFRPTLDRLSRRPHQPGA